MGFFVGEALVGDGNEIAHIDLLIGDQEGPVGMAFANALANQSAGHSNLLAVIRPNLAVKPSTVIVTKVTIKGMKQAVQMFGPAEAAVAWAVADEAKSGGFKNLGDVEDLAIVCGVFIHPQAENDGRIFRYNYSATRQAIRNAAQQEPSLEDVSTAIAKLGEDPSLAHPYQGEFDLVASLTELRKGFVAQDEEESTAE